ncbi:hypothetical protein GCM10025859_20720 [Alicyclobacillus fastidiosus]|nr:hypothetical protein GCM10025859_20720 [Alicyclobacillus fastidiosus]
MVTNPRISVCQPSTNLAFGPGFQPHHDTGLDGVVHIKGAYATEGISSFIGIEGQTYLRLKEGELHLHDWWGQEYTPESVPHRGR